MKVLLDYFKPSGKWYGEGEFETQPKELYEIWDQVKEMLSRRELPGLIKGHSKFITSVDVPDHPHRHPRLIFP